MDRIVLFLPLAVFAVIAVFALPQLRNDQTTLPSRLIDKPVPGFSLTPMPGHTSFTHKDLGGEVALVNVFGSWCAPCLIEHPVLVEIHKSGDVPIYGINWLDTPERGAAWLARHGNAYTRVGNDEDSRAAIALGVGGAPETFIVDKKGRIRYRHAGPITRETWEKTLHPIVQQLQQGVSSDS